jgi:peptidoglycan/xylan/chitin deacetylase (PgdA/CDA1 family)
MSVRSARLQHHSSVERGWLTLFLAGVLGIILLSCGDSPTDVVEEEPPSSVGLRLALVGPDTLINEVAREIPISVRVEDEVGSPRSGVAVRWTVLEGGGAIASASQSSSDNRGYAVAVWRLGTTAGLQRASAAFVAPGSSSTAEFTVEAEAGAAFKLILVTDSVLLNGPGETVYLAPSFTDEHGNEAKASDVTWSSGDDGVAIVAPDGLVTGKGAGAIHVTGSVGGVPDSLLVTIVPRGAITITFDDGWMSTYTRAFPALEEFGFQANVGVCPGILTYPAYMDLSQLQLLHDAGWSMVSHTMNHTRLTPLSDMELDYELREAREFLDNQGFRGSDVFIVPYHDWTDRERYAVSQHYRVARGVAADLFPTDSLVYWMPSHPFDLTGMEADALPYTTVEGRERLQGLLQRTLEEGRFLDLFFHRVSEEDFPAFREVLALLYDYRDRVLPYHELYPKYARSIY